MRWQCISQSWVNDSSLRFDVDYIFENITRVDKYYRWNELFEFVSYQKINLEELDDFQYAEIGNVNNNGSVLPITLSFSNRKTITSAVRCLMTSLVLFKNGISAWILEGDPLD